MAEIIRFHWADYILFVIVLIASAAIGIYYGFTGTRQKTTSEFFLGDRNMNLFPVTISILASFISAVSILGTPAEIYTFGIIYVLLSLSYFIAFPISVHVYLPMFHKLNLTSCHEVSILIITMLLNLLSTLYTLTLHIQQHGVLYGHWMHVMLCCILFPGLFFHTKHNRNRDTSQVLHLGLWQVTSLSLNALLFTAFLEGQGNQDTILCRV
jgi:Na+/pantothenate symporter